MRQLIAHIIVWGVTIASIALVVYIGLQMPLRVLLGLGAIAIFLSVAAACMWAFEELMD
jgi:hypothetical protein